MALSSGTFKFESKLIWNGNRRDCTQVWLAWTDVDVTLCLKAICNVSCNCRSGYFTQDVAAATIQSGRCGLAISHYCCVSLSFLNHVNWVNKSVGGDDGCKGNCLLSGDCDETQRLVDSITFGNIRLRYNIFLGLACNGRDVVNYLLNVDLAIVQVINEVNCQKENA